MNEQDDTRTEQDLKVLELISDWDETNPKTNIFYFNEGIKQARNRARGVGPYGESPSTHSRDSDFEIQRKVMLGRVQEGRARLKAALDAFDAFEAKYLDR